MNQPTRKHSKKREAIIQMMRSSKEHPSAEWIYSRLKPQYPDLSLGTVYRNLVLFREQGDIISLGSVGGQERFDATVEPHSHFVCNRCHKVIDLDFAFCGAEHYAEIEQLVGGTVNGSSVFFTGLCEACAKTGELPV